MHTVFERVGTGHKRGFVKLESTWSLTLKTKRPLCTISFSYIFFPTYSHLPLLLMGMGSRWKIRSVTLPFLRRPAWVRPTTSGQSRNSCLTNNFAPLLISYDQTQKQTPAGSSPVYIDERPKHAKCCGCCRCIFDKAIDYDITTTGKGKNTYNWLKSRS